MTMATKLILLIAICGISVVVGKSQSYADIPCLAIKGVDCIGDADCTCSGSRFICNRFLKCNRMTLMDIMVRQPCFGVFKSYCSKDSDCVCKRDKLVCERNECVKAKSVAAF